MNLLLSLADGVYRWSPPGYWDVIEDRETWRGTPVLFKGTLHWLTDSAITPDGVRFVPLEHEAVSAPLAYQDRLLWVSDKNTLTEYDGSTIRTVPFPLPASFPPLTNLVPGGDRLVAYGPGVRVSFEYHPAARRVFARPEHCDGLQSCVDIAWYPWLAEQLGTSIVSARPSAPSADPATFTVYVNDIAVLPDLEGEPAQLLTDYSERLCHVIWESDGTWHAVISEDGTVYQPATFVSAEAPTDAILYDNGTPTVEITKRPTYDPATKTVNIPYEISCSMSVDSVTVDVEYNEGTGWKPATPASGHPHHSGTTGLQPHAPYVFVHAYAHDLAKPHTSLQYRLTATLA